MDNTGKVYHPDKVIGDVPDRSPVSIEKSAESNDKNWISLDDWTDLMNRSNRKFDLGVA